MDTLKKKGFLIALLFSVAVATLGVLALLSSGEESALVDLPLTITYIMIGVGVLLSIGLPLANAVKAPETLKYTGIAVGGLALVFLIAYSTANGVVPNNDSGTYTNITTSNMKLAGGLLSTAIVLVVAGVIGLVTLEVKGLIKN